jgi:hypothetical protein
MAYVVARRGGHFEIRESIHTDKGPRARSLASFRELDDEVLAKARRRASRPFDAAAVRASAVRAGAVGYAGSARSPGRRRPGTQEFVESSRRMAEKLETRPPRPGTRRNPGDALIDLLDLVAQISSFGPPRAPEPLEFPLLARLRAQRVAAAAR